MEVFKTKEENKTRHLSAVDEFRAKYHARLYQNFGINKFKNNNVDVSDCSDESISVQY